MPVVLAQPEPYNPSISSGYGAAMALRDAAPMLNRGYDPYVQMQGPQMNPLALYAGKAMIDQQMQNQQQQNAMAILAGYLQNNQGGGGQLNVDASAENAPDPYGPGYSPDAGIDFENPQNSPSNELERPTPPVDAIGNPTGPPPSPPQVGAQVSAAAGGGPVGGILGAGAQALANRFPGAATAAQNYLSGAPQSSPTQPYANPATAPQPQQATPQAQPQGQQLEQPEFSTADQIELQRLKGARTRVQADARNGLIDPQTAQRAMALISMGIRPLQAMQQAAQMAAQQQAMQQQMQQQAQMTAIRSMDAAQLAQHVKDHTATLPDGTQIYINPITGHEHVLPNTAQLNLDRQQAARDRDQRARDLAADRLAQAREAALQRAHDAQQARAERETKRADDMYRAIAARVDAEMQAARKPGPDGKTMPPPPPWLASTQVTNRGNQGVQAVEPSDMEKRDAEVLRRFQTWQQHTGHGQQSQPAAATNGQAASQGTNGVQAFNALIGRLMNTPPAPSVRPSNIPRPITSLDQPGEAPGTRSVFDMPM